MLVEEFDQFGEICQRSGEPIDLVDDDDVDLSRLDVREQILQSGAVHRGARQAAVVVMVGDEPPSLVSLALDVGLARLALGIERVEFEIKIMLGRLARIDCAAKGLSFGCPHHLAFGRPAGTGQSTPTRSPKKRGPFQAVPVMARATAERLGYVASRQTKPPGTTVTV